MVITINGKDYKLYFGVGFVRAMDEKYFLTSQAGVKLGMSLSQKLPSLLSGDVVVLSEFLYEGTNTEDKRPTQAEIDAYIDECENIDSLFGEVISELKKVNATRKETVEAEKNLKEAEEAEKKRKAKKK